MNLHDPVAVQIEQVVVSAPGGPQASMLHRLVVRIRDLTGQLLKLTEVTLSAVGIHQWVDVNDQFVQELWHLPLGRGG